MEQNNLSDKDIFTKIWTSPKEVFKYINDTGYDKHLVLLLALIGISLAFGLAEARNLGDTFSLWQILVICIIGGGLFLGWVSLHLYATFLNWTGKWLKGEGDTMSILRMLSYAMIPSTIGVIFWILQIIIFGNELFESGANFANAGIFSGIFVLLLLLQLILAIWSQILCIIGISEVQKFSIGKSILNLLLPLTPIFVYLILILVFIFWL